MGTLNLYCSRNVLVYSFVLLIFTPRVTEAKYAEGHLVTHENWAFLARFCFLSEDGEFRYEIEYSEDSGPVNLLLYYDTEDQWPSVYRTNKTCQQKESVLNISNSQIVNLTTAWPISGCSREDSQSGTHGAVKSSIIRCVRARRFRTARERWWFIAVSNCNVTKGLNIIYKFLMTNGPLGDYWHEHLSADEFYILPVLIAYTVAYMFLILAVVMCSVELKARQFLHATYKLFIVSVSLQELGVMMQVIAYARYAVHGVGYPRIKNFGRISEAASEICFLLLLLLLAKGYTVTRGRLRLGSSIKLTVFICLYVVLTMCLYIYEKEYFDPGEVLYLYESPAGYGVVTLRIVAWWMFIYSTVFTLKHYPEKASFYYPFNLIGTLWFVSGPGFILAANSLIDKWVRESVVCGAMHFIAFAGHVLFLVLTMPSKANKNFPYHVRTNQIGVMEITGVAGNNSLYQFGHHNYEPQTARTVPMDLFTVSKQLELESNPIDYETQPYPHAIRGYTQTILLPFTIRDGPDSSGGEEPPEAPGRGSSPPQGSLPPQPPLQGTARSADVARAPRTRSDRLTSSAGAPRNDSFSPTAPYEDIGSTEELRGSASTISAATAERNRLEEERLRKQELSVHKLTEMFLAQSLKNPD